MTLDSGTPQGAILSPILFNIMMSDIPQQEHITVYIYADDITVTCVASEPQFAKTKMQRYLNEFAE